MANRTLSETAAAVLLGYAFAAAGLVAGVAARLIVIVTVAPPPPHECYPFAPGVAAKLGAFIVLAFPMVALALRRPVRALVLLTAITAVGGWFLWDFTSVRCAPL